MEKTNNVFIKLCQFKLFKKFKCLINGHIYKNQPTPTLEKRYIEDHLSKVCDVCNGKQTGILKYESKEVLIVFLEDLQKELGQEEHE